MKITLKIKDNIIGFKDVWEIQDNGQAELVIKHYDYSCERFKESEISSINVELENLENKEG